MLTKRVQWANVCCSQYSHSRVTNFKTHLKHNNHFTQLINEEIHLPTHMRLTFQKRLLRFFFYPISLMGIIMLLNWDSRYEQIQDICRLRNECYYYCTTDNFPSLTCIDRNVKIRYNGTDYEKFFDYPNPVQTTVNDPLLIQDLRHEYETCRAYTEWNPKMYPQEVYPYDGFSVHICFDKCRPDPVKQASLVDPNFQIDERPICNDKIKKDQGIICVHPKTNDCDVLLLKRQTCFDFDQMVCIDWILILYSIIISNVLQVLFQASLAKSREWTYYPTELDMMQDNEYSSKKLEQNNNPDQKEEPKCDVVLRKCFGELFAICLYVLVLCFLIVGLQQQISYGKPLTGLVEFAIAIGIDQVKSIPIQLVIWWTVIRRCGKFDVIDFTEWNDEEIANGGVEPSLYSSMRTGVRHFLETKYISNLILGMTLFLCVVIFTELSMPDESYLFDEELQQKTQLGIIFYVINYILLTFFIMEIALKLFSYGTIFLMGFINVFDSIVVFISFIFHIIDV